MLLTDRIWKEQAGTWPVDAGNDHVADHSVAKLEWSATAARWS
jgi:hypothetical protein